MPRKSKGSRGGGKKIIRVFCEGESEQVYTDFLKKRFANVANIQYPRKTGLFEEADARFKGDPSYRDNAEVIDEIWFFFDVETKDVEKWNSRLKIIKRLRRLRKDPPITVRLLMTTGCIEYWLLLHYRYTVPSVQTVAEKENMLAAVIEQEPTYAKGDYVSTARIAERYKTAIENARKTVDILLPEGMPGLKDTDERNEWLCKHCMTFSTVYEAIERLES